MQQAGILGGVPAPQRSRPLFRQGGGPVPGAPMGAPPMGGGMPQGMPGQQAAPMNPQLAGAIDLVDDDVEHLDLDPATEYALKVQEAADLLAGAKRELAMSQPQPQPSQVVPQLEQQITQAAQSGGLPAMAQRIQPGHQQLGINQQRRVQQALGGGQGRGGMPQLAGGPRGPGGLPQLPAPNMARPQMAAHGGIVGYQRGGDVQPIPALMDKYGNETVTDFLEAEDIFNRMQVRNLPWNKKQDEEDFYSGKRSWHRDPEGKIPGLLRRSDRFSKEFIDDLLETRSGPSAKAPAVLPEDGGWWEIIKEADRKRTAQVHEEQQLRREQGRSIRDYIPFMEPKGQLWIENALYDASQGIGSLFNKRRPEAGATGSAVLSETDTFLEATEILNNAESTEEDKAFARMQLEGLQDAPMRAEMLQQVDKINAARGAGMAGGGPIKRYQSVGSVESGRGDTPPGRIPIIHNIEQGLGNIGTQIRGTRESVFERQALMRLIKEFQEAGHSYEEAVVLAGQQLGGLGEQAPIERPLWHERIPVDQTSSEITEYKETAPFSSGQEIVDTPVSPPQLDPNLLVDPSATRGLPALPYEQAEFNPREQQLYDQVMTQAARDPVQEGIAAGQRVRDLMGADDLMARRAEEFEGLQSLREAQFDPKESLLRRWKAGLAQGAKQGLGGFGAGVGSEEDKILAEQLGVRESSVENMDKLIADLRALGLSQYKAEQEAQKMVATLRSQGLTNAQALLTALRATDDANVRAATQIGVARETGIWQEKIARIRDANNTDLMDKLEISARGLRREDLNLSYEESMEQAYEIYKEDQLSLGFARIGVNKEAAADQRNIKIMLAAIEAVDGRDSFAQQQLGIMNPNGSINEDKYWDAVEIATEKLGGLLKTMEGTTTTTPGDDRLEQIRERLQNPAITMEAITAGGLTPEELEIIADLFNPAD